MTGLDEVRWLSLQRMAQHCAETWRGMVPLTVMPYPDRRAAALDGMIEHLAAGGRDSDKSLFRAGANAIDRAGYEARKHAGRDWWWGDRQEPDWLAEEVTDRVAAVQLLAAFTPGQRAAVLLAVEMGGNVGRDGRSGSLSDARARARQLWVAPGETAGRLYRASRHGGGRVRVSKAARARYRAEAKARALRDEA